MFGIPGSPVALSKIPFANVLAVVPVAQGPLEEVCAPSSQKTVPEMEKAPVTKVVLSALTKQLPFPSFIQAVLVTIGGV